MRFAKGADYQQAVKKLLRSGMKASRIDSAWEMLLLDPRGHGRKFEPIAGRPGYWKSRLTNALHIVFVEERDDEGTVYVAIDICSHDDY